MKNFIKWVGGIISALIVTGVGYYFWPESKATQVVKDSPGAVTQQIVDSPNSVITNNTTVNSTSTVPIPRIVSWKLDSTVGDLKYKFYVLVAHPSDIFRLHIDIANEPDNNFTVTKEVANSGTRTAPGQAPYPYIGYLITIQTKVKHIEGDFSFKINP